MADNVDVLIVGAGAAGLAAFQELDRAGKRVVCVEARERIGGRIHTVRDRRSPIPIELGAEFVHGRPPEILEVVGSAALMLCDCTEHAVHVRNGKPHKNEDAWLQVDEVLQGMEKAVAEGREETFSEFLARSKYSDAAKELATSYVEGFNAARGDVIGIQSLVTDSKAADEIDGDRAFRILDGYESIPQWLISGVDELGTKLKLNYLVRTVRWTPGHAAVEVESNVTGAKHTISAKNVILTLPLGVLLADPGTPGWIQFDPEVPDIVDSAKQLRFGQVIRMILRFVEPVWEENEDFSGVGFLLSNEKHFPTWWTPLPVRARSITGWCSGQRPDELLGLPKTELVARAVHDLARILDLPQAKLAAKLETAYFHDWHADPFARGAYSYVPAGAMKARERLPQPVAGTLYFSGEATEANGHSATVHGAIASGRRAAKQILNAPIF